ncbi:MAG: DUF2953 domain-containing protein [Oscillospiraceae bacterium]|nr:DUF2953 domain-containing protein [Oscillospiraceae bacterium]
MWWLIVLGILLFLAFIPVLVRFSYDETGYRFSLLWGIIPIKRLPGKKRENHKKKSKEKTSSETSGGKLSELIPIIKIGCGFLNALRKKMKLKLWLHLVMAGDDPCDLAVNYGRTWAAAGSLIPLLEESFIIQKREIQIDCDFGAEETLVKAKLRAHIATWRLIGIAAKYGFRLLKHYMKSMKSKESGAENE